MFTLGLACPLLQDKKTEHYKTIVEQAAEARPGVIKLMDEALDHPDVAVCICSAATKAGFIKVSCGARVSLPVAGAVDGLCQAQVVHGESIQVDLFVWL